MYIRKFSKKVGLTERSVKLACKKAFRQAPKSSISILSEITIEILETKYDKSEITNYKGFIKDYIKNNLAAWKKVLRTTKAAVGAFGAGALIGLGAATSNNLVFKKPK